MEEVLWQVNQYIKYMQNYKIMNQKYGEDFSSGTFSISLTHSKYNSLLYKYDMHFIFFVAQTPNISRTNFRIKKIIKSLLMHPQQGQFLYVFALL